MVGGSYYTSSPSTSMAIDLWETLKDSITALALAISFTLCCLRVFLVHQIMLTARDFDEQMQPREISEEELEQYDSKNMEIKGQIYRIIFLREGVQEIEALWSFKKKGRLKLLLWKKEILL